MDSTMTESGHCSMCRKNRKTTPASNYCTDCKTYFCNKCLKVHLEVSNYQDHDITKLTGHKRMKLEEAFMCKEHDKKIEHFCRSCVKPVCKVCNHKRCNDVVTIQNILPEVKGQLMKRQERLGELVERTNIKITECDVEVQELQMQSASVRTDITQSIQTVVNLLNEKKAELLAKLEDQTDRQSEKLRSKMTTKQTEIQMYQQQSQFIQQALELEDEAQLFEMYLLSGSGAEVDITETQREDSIDVADVIFLHDLDKLNDEIGKMDVSSVDNTTATPDLTATPVLHEVIDAKLGESDRCDVRDVVVLKQEHSKVTLFTDFQEHRLKALYVKEGQTCSSVLQVSTDPRCITVISENTVGVSFMSLKNIITVAVTPDLELLSTIQTSKVYWGLSSLDKSMLVAGSKNPPSVDLIDMTGTILKTFTTLPALGQSFISPRYIHVTSRGTILVSDFDLKYVICLTQSGDMVFSYTPTGDRALLYPYGITSTSAGDILVADWGTNKVIHLNKSGEFIRDILTSEDGLKKPFGLCFDDDKLCVTVKEKGLHKYKFVTG